MSRLIALLGFCLLLLAVAGYLHYRSDTFEVRIPEQQIRQKLAEKLPLQKTYLYLFELTLENPRVDLLEDSGRIAAGLDIRVRIKGGGEDRVLRGTVDASGSLRYAAAEGQFYLAEPEIEKLSVSGLPEKRTAQIRSVIETALGEYYAEHPVYRLNTDDIKQATAKMVLKNVSVDGDDLVVTMGL